MKEVVGFARRAWEWGGSFEKQNGDIFDAAAYLIVLLLPTPAWW